MSGSPKSSNTTLWMKLVASSYSLAAGRRLDRREAVLHQGGEQSVTRVLLVFDDQYGAGDSAIFRGLHRVGCNDFGWRSIGAQFTEALGQSKFYAASPTRPVVDPHASAVRFDDGTANGPTETYAAVPLGDLAPPIELLENLLVLIDRDAGTAVDDGDLDPRALDGNPYGRAVSPPVCT